VESEKGLQLLHVSWDDVQSLTEEIARQIQESGYVPDVIVAVSRGGFDPARILCDQLGIKRLASLQVEYYSDINETSSTPEIVFPLNTEVPDTSILIVDDVSDTGTSLQVARDQFRPDFSASVVESWIIYPWEIMESINSITEKLRLEGLSSSNVDRELIRLGFSRKQLEMANYYL
jgi:hypoxanthine phosphoribosyltransferase